MAVAEDPALGEFRTGALASIAAPDWTEGKAKRKLRTSVKDLLPTGILIQDGACAAGLSNCSRAWPRSRSGP